MFDDVRRRPYVFCGGNAPNAFGVGLADVFWRRREQMAAGSDFKEVANVIR
jgi:hypothetical protein